jgi:uncharacterized coiled-coil protein SlyX
LSLPLTYYAPFNDFLRKAQEWRAGSLLDDELRTALGTLQANFEDDRFQVMHELEYRDISEHEAGELLDDMMAVSDALESLEESLQAGHHERFWSVLIDSVREQVDELFQRLKQSSEPPGEAPVVETLLEAGELFLAGQLPLEKLHERTRAALDYLESLQAMAQASQPQPHEDGEDFEVALQQQVRGIQSLLEAHEPARIATLLDAVTAATERLLDIQESWADRQAQPPAPSHNQTALSWPESAILMCESVLEQTVPSAQLQLIIAEGHERLAQMGVPRDRHPLPSPLSEFLRALQGMESYLASGREETLQSAILRLREFLRLSELERAE